MYDVKKLYQLNCILDQLVNSKVIPDPGIKPRYIFTLSSFLPYAFLTVISVVPPHPTPSLFLLIAYKVFACTLH